MSFRSVNDSGVDTVYSDWTQVSYTVPTVNWDKVGLLSCVFATEAQLEKVADAKGYSVEKSTADGVVTVRVSKKDPNNTGFLNGLGRFLAGGLSTAENDFSNLGSTLETYVNSQDFENSIYNSDGVIDAAKNAAAGLLNNVKNGMISNAFGAIDENYIVYIFQYSDVNAGADICIKTELESGNEDDVSNIKNNCKTDNLGRYISGSQFGRNYYIDICSITESGLAKYAITAYKS